MSFCTYAGDAGIFATTPIANLFIQEYMLNAPGDYVKVYIYGLMQSVYPSTAEKDIRKFALSLGMDIDTIQKAFSYWLSKGLVRNRKGGQGFEYLDVRNVMYDRQQSLSERRIHDFSELSNRIAAAAPNRKFSTAELELLYDLKDIDNFEEDTIVLLIEYGTARYKRKFDRTRLEALAKEWKTKHIRTAAQAREYILGIELRNSPANDILTQLGIIHRNVSVAEHNLYQKWHTIWRFSHDAILMAAQTPSVRNPNFNYVDKKLKTFYEKGLNTAQKIRASTMTKDEIDHPIRTCKFRLGLVGSITDEHRRFHQRWRESYGFQEEAILLACDEAVAQGSPSFKEVERILSEYMRRGTTQPEQIASDRLLTQDAQMLLRTAGVTRIPTESDKQQIAKWLNHMPFEVLMQAAEYAKDATKPTGYLARIVNDWQQKGIRSVSDARAEHDSIHNPFRLAPMPTHKSGTVHFQQEPQYSSKELNTLIDIMPYTKEKTEDTSSDEPEKTP